MFSIKKKQLLCCHIFKIFITCILRFNNKFIKPIKNLIQIKYLIGPIYPRK